MPKEKVDLVSAKFSKKNRQVKWETRSSVIKDDDGNTVFECKDVEVPETWSQLATDILASKYLRKSGLFGNKDIGETSLLQVVTRIVTTIGNSGKQQGYFTSNSEQKIFEDELSYMLINQIGAFNSPVWFNCGLWHEYSIVGGGNAFAWDEAKQAVRKITNSYERPQCSACFIQSVDDDLMSIYELMKNEAKLFKYGSGTGTNFSKLRSKYEKLSGGGTSSGLLSFLEVFDRMAGATKSGGVTRRAAKMVCLDMDHPEIEEFIEWKVNEEKKVRALIAQGYSSDFNGEAYHTISGQNSNNSVRITDKFMDAVKNNQTWDTIFRTTGEVYKTYQAKDLWEKLVNAAWNCADPGVQFDTTINEWHTCPNTSRINASNPCSEFMFLDDSACNLASLNLVKFLNANNTFNVSEFCHAIRIFILAQDILVDLGSYPTARIADNSHKYRPLGLGYANLGGLLMLMGLPYDSDEGRLIAGIITSLMTAQAYLVSGQIAEKKGAFVGYDLNREKMNDVLYKHSYKASTDFKGGKSLHWNSSNLALSVTNLISVCTASWDLVVKHMKLKAGFRNAQVTLLAPTGTIGLLMDCDTTGIEPDYSLIKYKKLAGGGFVKLSNSLIGESLRRLEYSSNQIKSILNHVLEVGTLEGSQHIDEKDLAIFDCANKCGEGKRYITALGHIKMMAAVQPHLSGAISKTINVQEDVTKDDIAYLYLMAWKMGLKSVSIYRDKCKASQPLSSSSSSSNSADVKVISNEIVTPALQWIVSRKKLPNKRKGFTQSARIGGQKLFLRTGEYEDGTVGEIFLDMHKEGSTMRSMLNCFAIAISIGLQYGVPLETFVRMFTFTRFEPCGVVDGHENVKIATSIVDYIFRVLGIEYLKQYDLAHVKPEEECKEIKEDTTAKEDSITSHLDSLMGDAPLCELCGYITVRNGSCYKCTNCGNSLGCS